MPTPIIGITTGYAPQRDGPPQQAVNHDYIAAIERVGACPLILPMTERRDTLRPLFDLLDGLVITGGPGITEGLVGALPDDLPPVSPVRYQNDAYAFDAAQKKQIPILGICYGMQFINARFGGTLYADVQHQCNTGPHSPKRTGGAPINHPITLDPGTHLARILNVRTCDTNSYHLQALKTIAPGLRPSAHGPDRVIEGIETPDGRIIGVQFHPEKMPGPFWDRLFQNLIQKTQK